LLVKKIQIASVVKEDDFSNGQQLFHSRLSLRNSHGFRRATFFGFVTLFSLETVQARFSTGSAVDILKYITT
jgi:hypothetical protein